MVVNEGCSMQRPYSNFIPESVVVRTIIQHLFNTIIVVFYISLNDNNSLKD